jgi:hypothetical protein
MGCILQPPSYVAAHDRSDTILLTTRSDRTHSGAIQPVERTTRRPR